MADAMKIMLVVCSYLMGSISFAYLFAKGFRGIDIRTVGSGNPGATNVARLMGLKAALVVLLLDALKGWIVAVTVPRLVADPGFVLLCGLAVIAGHNWPVFLSFRGGKGVATTLGFFLGFAFLPTIGVVAFVAAVIYLTRYVSLGSIVGSIAIPVLMVLSPELRSYVLYGLLICVVILWRHGSNIKRLLQGTESRLEKKRQVRS
jgi:acyl phosphate:glycerol-3-phosphate acyltransferase